MTLTPQPAVSQPAVSRRALVGGAGLAGLAVAAPAGAAPASRVNPLDLDFEVVDRQRAVALVAPRFRTVDDSFRTRRRYTRLDGPTGPAGATRVAGGEMRLL